VVLDKNDNIASEQELSEDLLAITTVFVARHRGSCSAQNRRKRKRERLEAQDSETSEDERSEREAKSQEESEQKEKVPAGKSFKIRLYPTSKQKTVLLQWFGAARWTYNQCVAYWRSDQLDKKYNKKHLRSLFLNDTAVTQQSTPELQTKMKDIFVSTPYDIRDEGMNDFLKAIKTSNVLKKNGRVKQYGFKFRSRKDRSQSIGIGHKHWKNGSCFTSFFGKDPIPSAEEYPSCKYDMRMTMDNLGQFYLCIPQPLELKDDNQVPIDTEYGNILSLDPGVRTFQTGYDPSGKVIEFSKGDKGRIVRLCHHMDNLQSRIDLCKNARKSRRMKRALVRMQHRIRNLVDEMHKKLVSFMVRNYRVILLPDFNTSQMVVRGARKIRSKTVRSMLTWSHYRFKQRLLNKTREHLYCKVLIVTEEYTSKTCGVCGHIHQKLGGSKVFKCPSCRGVTDRDVNGARNILIKFLTEFNNAAWKG
jgi:putative transposase